MQSATSAQTDTASRRTIPLWVIITCGCFITMIGFGGRSSLGLYTLPITEDMGWTRESFGLAIAVQNLVWGLIQPIAGGFSDKYGTARVLAFGGVVYAAGFVGMSMAPTESMFLVFAGIVMGVGISTASFGLVMAAFSRVVPPEKRTIIFGVATAASSMGQFVFAPIGQSFISQFGWQSALVYMAGFVLLIVPLSFALRGKATAQDDGGAKDEAAMKFTTALSRAWSHGSYRLLVIGFFVCGFHLAFITVHMPAYLVQCGLSPAVGSWAIAIIGLFNVAGSLASGYLASIFPKQLLLAAIYFLRAVATGLFLLFPVTEPSTYIYAAALGVLWLATVPPTAGLVSLFFGVRYMGMLYGIVFLSHQIGSFLGIYLGGLVFDLQGSYALVWYLGIILALGAAALHLPIKEMKSPTFNAQPAAA